VYTCTPTSFESRLVYLSVGAKTAVRTAWEGRLVLARIRVKRERLASRTDWTAVLMESSLGSSGGTD
jgi:hypothetical protein